MYKGRGWIELLRFFQRGKGEQAGWGGQGWSDGWEWDCCHKKGGVGKIGELVFKKGGVISLIFLLTNPFQSYVYLSEAKCVLCLFAPYSLCHGKNLVLWCLIFMETFTKRFGTLYISDIRKLFIQCDTESCCEHSCVNIYQQVALIYTCMSVSVYSTLAVCTLHLCVWSCDIKSVLAKNCVMC